MMLIRTRTLLFTSLMAGALCCGCSQKKPVVAVPQTPTATTAPQEGTQPLPTEPQPQTQQGQATPAQGTPPPEPQPEPSPVQPQPAQPAADKTSPAKTKSANPHPNGKKPVETARSRKTTVPSGDEPVPATGQISPSLSNAEIAHNQTTTEQLLQSAEAALSSIKRQLSEEEQAIVTQVHDYMNQSRQATKANDLTRAYNLALKARLLSDDLAKRR
jgi:hypothetical protein